MKRYAAALIAAAGLVLGLTACDLDTTTTDTSESHATATGAEAPAEEATGGDLATQVEDALLLSNAVSSFRELPATSPGYWISEIEEMNGHTVRVYVQTDLTKDESENTGRWVISMSCHSVPDLDTVVVRPTDGRDVNVYKRDTPAAANC